MSKLCKDNNIVCNYKKAGNICLFENRCGKQSADTNADKIRSMSDDELAEFLTTFVNTFGEEYEGEMSCLD